MAKGSATGSAAAAASLLAALVSVPAQAQDILSEDTMVVAQSSSNPFSALVGERRERRVENERNANVQRFVLASDNRALLIQPRTRTARVQFLCGPNDRRLACTLDPEAPAAEIMLLTITRGPRGDSIFKNAEGETLIRIASYGGATVFWPGEVRGFAASKSFGETGPLELPVQSFQTAERRAKQASALVSAATGAPIVFDLIPDSSENAAVLADAVLRAAIGMRNVADDGTGAEILAGRISRVLFQAGSASGLSVDGKTLRVTYVPDQDIAGRPSARVVERFLEDSL